MTVIASREDLILRQLKWRERADLARCYLRFQVDTPVVVDVAVPAETVPFWIGDLQFRPTELKLKNSDTSWKLYRRVFEAGVIGLGVNGLDRRPLAHYAVFVRSRNHAIPFRSTGRRTGHQTIPALEDHTGSSGRERIPR